MRKKCFLGERETKMQNPVTNHDHRGDHDDSWRESLLEDLVGRQHKGSLPAVTGKPPTEASAHNNSRS